MHCLKINCIKDRIKFFGRIWEVECGVMNHNETVESQWKLERWNTRGKRCHCVASLFSWSKKSDLLPCEKSFNAHISSKPKKNLTLNLNKLGDIFQLLEAINIEWNNTEYSSGKKLGRPVTLFTVFVQFLVLSYLMICDKNGQDH